MKNENTGNFGRPAGGDMKTIKKVMDNASKPQTSDQARACGTTDYRDGVHQPGDMKGDAGY